MDVTTKEDILAIAKTNPTVRVCVDYVESHYLGWGEAMMLAVSELVKENAYLHNELVAIRAINQEIKAREHYSLEKC